MRWFLGQSSSTTSKAGPSSLQISPVESSTSSGTPIPQDTAPTSKTVPTVRRLEAVLKDEERYQEKQYPDVEDVPGCMTLFDEFMMCYALVPQLRNLYRHGEPRDCTYKFREFKYCMSLKGEDPEDKRKLWIKRRAEWWAERRIAGSSEDVWDVRSTPLENFPPLHPEDQETT